MTRLRIRTALGLCLACLLLSALAPPGAAGGGAPAPLAPPPGERCPVCGMFVAKYPDWVAQIRFTNRETLFFDGAKDLFKFYFDIDRYGPGRSTARIAAVYVTDYYTLAAIDARQALFVIGADVYGPMGRELIPFATAAEAATFSGDHHGKATVRFDDVSLSLLRTLD